MALVHEGGCLCGAVRYRVTGEPLRSHVCHCTFCQRRTGAAAGLVAVFDGKDVQISGGPLTRYEHRSDESGRWLRLEFCPRCGTNIGFTFERVPTARAVSIGTFDDPDWLKVKRHIWTRSALDCMPIPADVERFEKHFV